MKRQNNKNNYFDSDCYKKRKELQRLAKLMSSKPNDIHIRNSFYQTKRNYKPMIKIRKRDQKEIKLNQLMNLKPTEIKKKWDIIKSIIKTENQNDPAENKGLFRFRMRNEILRRSEKIETRSKKHDFSDRNSSVYVIQ